MKYLLTIPEDWVGAIQDKIDQDSTSYIAAYVRDLIKADLEAVYDLSEPPARGKYPRKKKEPSQEPQ